MLIPGRPTPTSLTWMRQKSPGLGLQILLMAGSTTVAQSGLTRVNRASLSLGAATVGTLELSSMWTLQKKWQTITAMSNGRHYHTSSFMNGSVYSLGGEGGAVSTYEKLSGGSWTATNLRKQRKYHASVSLPDKTLTCIGGDNLG